MTLKKIAKIVFDDKVICITGHTGEKLPEDISRYKPKILLSFLSPWILPKHIIETAEIALNWHPASRDYPGIGCYNFALYERAHEFGATCHFMAEKVDTGAIVEERRFPLFETDSVETLKLRTMITLISMFHDTISSIAQGSRPQSCGLAWSRKPFTRRELNALTVIQEDMSEDEVRRRIRATTYPGYPGASVVVGGETFIFPVPNRLPLA